LRAVPFENLDIHLGRPIVLAEDALFDKIVRRRRGGFCYELNGLFAALLRDLEFDVTLLAAQFSRDVGQPAPETDHLVLAVRTEDADQPWLADVGAGRDSFAVPLRTTTAAKQPQPAAGASFRLVPEGEGRRLMRRERGGPWEPGYHFTWQPRTLADFEEGSLFHQTSPHSHFPLKRVCTLLTRTGRVTLIERRLIATVNGTRQERELADETEYRAVLRQQFGITLDP
jgi:N-hydroxyarylamine O-acetyltransferase